MIHKAAIDLIMEEFYDAYKIHGRMHSKHEGYALIKEELDELWDVIKTNKSNRNLREEAAQIGAMAMNFLVDCCHERDYDD